MHTPLMAICSSSNHSPPFPNTSFSSSSYSTTNSFLKLLSNYNGNSPIVLYAHSSSNYTCITVQEEDPFVSPTSAGIETTPFLHINEREHFWRNGAAIRRKRRRKRRSTFSKCDDEDEKFLFSDKNAGKSRFMTPKEEARFSWHLKERARIEAIRTEALAKIEGEHELSSTQWAKAIGISQHNLDRIIWNGKLSEKRITTSYLRLVVSIASSYQGKGLSLQDLTQEGCIGLLRGAIKFNPDKGYKLSTYAYWWIRQAITRAIAKKSKIIRLPGTINELVPKICEANAVLCRKLQRFPTYEEIAEAIDANSSSVRLAIERNKSPISLDGGSISLQAIIPGPDEMTPEAMVKKEALKPEIEKLLEPLCDREANILRLHYGLNGGAPWSFEEIGKLLELSRERVRQINSSALSKLRQMAEIDDLKYFI